MSGKTLGDRWLNEAASLRRRVNIAWWYQSFAPLTALVALLLGSFLLIARRYQWQTQEWAWQIAIMGVLGAASWAWHRSQARWITTESALVRLEADLALNNALSTAHEGRGSWPPFPDKGPILRWKLGRLALPLIGSASFLLLGAFLPITPVEDHVIENQPYTWTRLESEVEELLEEDLIDDSYAEELKKRINELKQQEADEWFSASSLEATDSLQQSHSREMNRLHRDLMKIEPTLRKLGDSTLGEARRNKLAQQFAEAAEAMRNGQLKPNQDLMKKLTEAAKNGTDGMSAEERAEMQKRLKELADRMQEMQGEGQNGEEGMGEPRPPGPGGGEPDRGPGTARDLFGAASPDLDSEKFERFDGNEEAPDPGDLLDLEEIEHKLDENTVAPTMSGETANQGLGGDRVWKDALDPDEQKSLKQFFETQP